MQRILLFVIVLALHWKGLLAFHAHSSISKFQSIKFNNPIIKISTNTATSSLLLFKTSTTTTTMMTINDSHNKPKQSIFHRIRSINSQLSTQFNESLADAKIRPFKYLSIPIAAAIIGYVTNYIGVKMLFYPIKMRGLIFHQWDAQPLALFGWQGIVPAKRVVMSSRLVDVTLSKLLNIPVIFRQLNPTQLSDLLINSLGPAVAIFPRFITRFFLRRTCTDVIVNAERVMDLKSLVVNGLTQDPTVLGAFFQRVAHKELQFLIDSGFGFGFLLGLLQMVQWMIYPKDWTLVAGRVGCLHSIVYIYLTIISVCLTN